MFSRCKDLLLEHSCFPLQQSNYQLPSPKGSNGSHVCPKVQWVGLTHDQHEEIGVEDEERDDDEAPGDVAPRVKHARLLDDANLELEVANVDADDVAVVVVVVQEDDNLLGAGRLFLLQLARFLAHFCEFLDSLDGLEADSFNSYLCVAK